MEVEQFLQQYNITSKDSLKRYGVKDMSWGKRKTVQLKGKRGKAVKVGKGSGANGVGDGPSDSGIAARSSGKKRSYGELHESITMNKEDLIASKSNMGKVKYEQLTRTFNRYKKPLTESGELARKK